MLQILLMKADMNNLIAFIIIISFTNNAYAYLDGGFITMVIQSIVAVSAIAFLTIRVWLSRITDILKKIFKIKKNNVDK